MVRWTNLIRGAISFAAREKLDNLCFLINCNLQRLDITLWVMVRSSKSWKVYSKALAGTLLELFGATTGILCWRKIQRQASSANE